MRYRRKGQVTIVGCACASGHVIPPIVIFDAQKLNPSWTEGGFPGTKYGLSSNGWINMELFEAWLSDHFLQHAVSARPLLLLLDGHSNDYQPELLRQAREHNVIMLCLPPHTTHEAQPLDCRVFGPHCTLVKCLSLLLATEESLHVFNSVHCHGEWQSLPPTLLGFVHVGCIPQQSKSLILVQWNRLLI